MTQDTAPTAPADAPLSTEGGVQRTTINSKWRRKMWIFIAVLAIIGLWGLVDASYIYPNRGKRAAEMLEYNHLQAVMGRNNGRLTDAGASIADPKAEYTRLKNDESNKRLSSSDLPTFQWLEQLSFVNQLAPEHTTIPRQTTFAGGVAKGGPVESAQARSEALKRAPHADPLKSYDIPVQWLICVVGLGWAGYILALMGKVRRKVYTWDPAAKRLTLPEGPSFTPADLAEIDKRKWHKFFVSLTIKPGHPQLGGKVVELDLLRYEPLESWVLEMERIAFPEEAGQSAGQEPTAE